VLALVGAQEAGQIPEGGQSRFQGVIAAGACASSTGSVLGPHPRGIEGDHRGPQRVGDRVESASAPAGGEPFGLIGGHGQPAQGEEVLEHAGEGTHRSPRLARAFQQRLGRVGVLVVQEPAQVGDEPAGSGRAVTCCHVRGEVTEPLGRVGQSLAQVFGPDEGPGGVLLPAG
jgi:hypothetical protein